MVKNCNYYKLPFVVELIPRDDQWICDEIWVQAKHKQNLELFLVEEGEKYDKKQQVSFKNVI